MGVPMGRKHRLKHFEEFPPHTRMKHLVLKGYLGSYIPKIALGVPGANRLTIIDGFAGRGYDGAGQGGSPVIIAREAAGAQSTLKTRFQRRITIRMDMVEADEAHFAELVAYMEPFGDTLQFHRGTLAEVLPKLLRTAGNDPTFVFIDPYGIKGLDHAMFGEILSRPRAELFVLIDADGADRLLRVATASDTKANIQRYAAAQQPELFTDEKVRLALIDAESKESRLHLEQTAKASASHLLTATGGEAWRMLARNKNASTRREGIVNLFDSLFRDLGAAYTTKVPIYTATQSQAYTLVHASKNPSGRVVMKEAVQAALNKAHEVGYDEAVLQRIRCVMAAPIEVAVEEMVEEFADSEIGWSAQLRPFLLSETQLWPWQMEEVKSSLKNRGWQAQGRTVRFRIPS